ncbi:helix-turn-helix transcriptional regulator [Solimonas soli]|uniref:helix-turn-helix transcriptional regulator n=1 Tax=Solimonas soli TaxID=413479 RepID=UPI0004860DA8|nr:LuxR C-terminal-related transcriptional regulator [Solimonas soli]
MIVSNKLHRESAANIAAAFNGMPLAAFVANELGDVIACNDAAKMLIRRRQWVRLENGRLEFLNPADTRRLHVKLSDVHPANPGKMQISGTGRGGEMAEIAVSRIRGGDSAFGPSGLSLIIIKVQRYAADHEILYGLRGESLTRAELAVAEHLVLGRRTLEIANIRQVSVETIRSQMKSIYAKLNVRNQIELMKVLQAAAA